MVSSLVASSWVLRSSTFSINEVMDTNKLSFVGMSSICSHIVILNSIIFCVMLMRFITIANLMSLCAWLALFFVLSHWTKPHPILLRDTPVYANCIINCCAIFLHFLNAGPPTILPFLFLHPRSFSWLQGWREEVRWRSKTKKRQLTGESVS